MSTAAPALLPMALAMIRRGSAALIQSAGHVAVRQSSTYRLEEVGTTATLRYQHGFVILVGVVSLLVLGVGLFLLLRSSARRFGAMLALFGGMFAFIGAPDMWMDRVVITPTEIRQTMGFWFSPRYTIGFRYADVRLVSIRQVKQRRSTHRVWLVSYTSGIQEEISPGDLWDNSQNIIVERLRGFGVQFDPVRPAEGGVWAQPVIVGVRQDSAGSFGVRRTAFFGRFDTIYVLVPTMGTAAVAVIGARWLYHTGELVQAQVDTVALTGPANTEFHIMKHGAWPVGSYRVEISLDGQRVGGAPFMVVP